MLYTLCENLSRWLRTYKNYLLIFFYWLGIGIILGLVCGLVGTAFAHSLNQAAYFRESFPILIALLPLGGVLIVFLYHHCRLQPTDTNGVLLAVHTPSKISFSTAPLIFVTSVITHLFGGSAGREGAALQLGGVLGWHTASLLHLDEKDTHVVVMAGMSAVFSALFGTPVTAAIFAMEVASIGIFHFSAIVPCLTSSLIAAQLSRYLGVTPEGFFLEKVLLHSSPTFVLGSILIALCVSILSIIFCVSLKYGHVMAKRISPNPYLRIIFAGIIISFLTWCLGNTDYNGAGVHMIEHAMQGSAKPFSFLLKLVFTVITMSCGYKGGEIVPAMFIGATAGCLLGNVLGLPVGLGAAIGLLSMFCGSLNCPISSIFLGIELFGGDNLYFFAIAVAVSYMLSCNFSLYSEQKIIYSKTKAVFINRYTD